MLDCGVKLSTNEWYLWRNAEWIWEPRGKSVKKWSVKNQWRKQTRNRIYYVFIFTFSWYIRKTSWYTIDFPYKDVCEMGYSNLVIIPVSIRHSSAWIGRSLCKYSSGNTPQYFHTFGKTNRIWEFVQHGLIVHQIMATITGCGVYCYMERIMKSRFYRACINPLYVAGNNALY